MSSRASCFDLIVMPSVPYLVELVLTFCSPRQIGEVVVRRVTVKVPHDLGGKTYSNEGERNKTMHSLERVDSVYG